MSAKRLKAELRRTRGEDPVKSSELLSTGSTVLNLACSDRYRGGIPAGRYVLLVGDSSSGKTFLTLTIFAEAKLSKFFKDHRIIYWGPEGGAQMNLSKFFGRAVQDEIELEYPETIEDFYFDIDDKLKEGVPFIGVLDSIDALTSKQEQKAFTKQKAARRGGTEAAGDFGDGKAKKNSANLRRLLSRLRKTKSILFVICQTRDNIGFTAKYVPKTRAGGRSLKFYADLEIWTSVREKIKINVNGKKRQVGVVVKADTHKNRGNGKERSVTFPIYWSVGIDDVGGCVDYLIEEGHWKTNNKGVSAPEFDYNGSIKSLIRLIEDDGREKELRMIVAGVWREIEEKCTVERKPRYA